MRNYLKLEQESSFVGGPSLPQCFDLCMLDFMSDSGLGVKHKIQRGT